MTEVVEILRQYALQSIMFSLPSIDKRATERLLSIHLEPGHFPMPIMDTAIGERLIDWCRGEESIAAADNFLVFENTKSITGIARVLARTHINRQGVGAVTRGAQWPAQSPRVVQLFEFASTEEDLRSWLDFDSMVGAWLQLGLRYRDATAGADRNFDQGDIDSLKALAKLTPRQALNLTAREVPGVTKLAWAKVVLGLYTGLVYLERRYRFDASHVWHTLDMARTAIEVDALWRDAQKCITEFGHRLAPSFFADLGCQQFVKADTHVSDVTKAALNLKREVAAQECIDFVRHLAADVGCSPRGIDKLIYFACSGKFYLAGVKPKKSSADMHKRLLLNELRRGRTPRCN
jgi:hypothetical protein